MPGEVPAVSTAGHRTMTHLEDLWRRKPDDQIIDASACLDEYGDDARAIIQAEFLRRRLVPPWKTEVAPGVLATITRLQRRFVGLVTAQWLSLILVGPVTAYVPASVAATVGLLFTLVFVITLVALPLTGRKLLALLEVDSPGKTASLMYMPLFSLLVLIGSRGIREQWSKRHGIELGLFGPKR